MDSPQIGPVTRKMLPFDDVIMKYRDWDKFLHPFDLKKSISHQVWKWISYFTPHCIEVVITYPCWEFKLSYVSKRDSQIRIFFGD